MGKVLTGQFSIEDLDWGEPGEDDLEPVAETKGWHGLATLRPYQREAVYGGHADFPGFLPLFEKSGIDSALAVMATGSGKTPTFAELGNHYLNQGKGVLVLSHRDELIRQAAKTFSRIGRHALIEKAEERALGEFEETSQLVVASVATMNGRRLQQWPKGAFSLIVSDECHHSLANGWRSIIDYFGVKHAGFTATPDRLDNKNVGRMFQELAYEYNIRDAVKDQWLVPLQILPLQLDPPVDLRSVRISAGDFNNADLDHVIQESVGRIANALAQEKILGSRPTVAFLPDIESSKGACWALNDVGISADYISCHTRNRAAKIERFRNGDFQVLCNAMILTEGADLPFVSAILLMRPSKSRALVSQMIGRGTRLFEGKENCLVVDLPCLTQQHKLVSPVQLYDDSGIDDRVIQRAREIVEDRKEGNLDKAIEIAQLQIENEDRIRIQRRSVVVKPMFRYDPLSVMESVGLKPLKPQYSDWMEVRPPSEKMVDYMVDDKIGIEDRLTNLEKFFDLETSQGDNSLRINEIYQKYKAMRLYEDGMQSAQRLSQTALIISYAKDGEYLDYTDFPTGYSKEYFSKKSFLNINSNCLDF